MLLRHLLRLTRKDADPLDFKFIEHHKTTTTSFGQVLARCPSQVDGLDIFHMIL